jgi:hypothetical protein
LSRDGSTMKPEQLSRWAARARPGEDVVYSTGVRPGDAIGAAVRKLHASGMVALTSKRVDGGFRFIAQRLPDPRPSQMQGRKLTPRGRFTVGADSAKATTRMVFQLLRRAAQRDEPCPTNAQLARMVGLKDAVAASYRVRRLVRDGLIRVEEPSPLERRVVTIVASGKQTRRAKL